MVNFKNIATLFPALKEKQVIGLDIGTNLLKMVELKRQRGTILLQSYGIEPLPREAIINKEIMDRQAVVDKLKTILDRTLPEVKHVAVNIVGSGIISKRISLPLAKRELEERIELEIKEQIPFDLAEVTWDYKILKTEGKKTEIILVAVKNELVYQIIDILKSVELIPVAIDLDALAIIDTLSFNGYLSSKGTMGILNIGYTGTEITVVKDGLYEVNREIPLGTKVYLEALTRFLDMPIARAWRVLLGEEKEKSEEIFKSIHDKMLEHLDRVFPTLESYPLTTLYLVGGGAYILNLREVLNTHYKIPVEIVNPLRKLKTPPYLTPFEERGEKTLPTLACAVGLALRKIERVKLEVDLLPKEERPVKKIPPLTPIEISVAGVPIILALSVAILFTHTLNRKTNRLKTELEALKQEESQLLTQIKILEALEERGEEIEKRISVLETLGKGRFLPIRLMSELNLSIPDGVWFTSIKEEINPPSLRITGSAFSIAQITILMKNLARVPLFKEVGLVYTKKGDKEVVDFEILINLVIS